MSKISFGLFVANMVLNLICIALRIPVAWWQWSITVALGMHAFRSWREKAAHDEKMESIYGRYDRPNNGKPPEYHGL